MSIFRDRYVFKLSKEGEILIDFLFENFGFLLRVFVFWVGFEIKIYEMVVKVSKVVINCFEI